MVVTALPPQQENPLSAGDLLPQGVARGGALGSAHRSVTYLVVNWVRRSLYRPGLKLLKRLLGGGVFVREPVFVDTRRDLVSHYTLLHPAEMLDFGDPTKDPFLGCCQYIEDGKLFRPNIFVCELERAKLYPSIGLVFDGGWRPVLESILDLGRFHNFRRQLRPWSITRRAGVFSSVQHIFHNNHWHWTVDSLAQVWSLERYMEGKSLTLLMPDLLPAHQREHLELLLPSNFRVEYAPSEAYLECEHFVLPSYVSSRANAFLPPEYFSFLRERVFTRLAVTKSAAATRRFYVSRSRAKHRRVLNEAEVLAVLLPLGFECVWMEDYSFAEQVRMMRQAECLISPHGAGVACMIYGDNLKVAVLYPEARPAGYFYTLARGLGHRHFQTNADLMEDDDFVVDLDQLRDVVLRQMQLG